MGFPTFTLLLPFNNNSVTKLKDQMWGCVCSSVLQWTRVGFFGAPIGKSACDETPISDEDLAFLLGMVKFKGQTAGG